MVSESPFLWPPIKRYSRFFFGTPSGGRPFPANRAANSFGNFCPSLSCYHRHPSRPREPPKVVFQPRIGGSVQSQPIPALHTHYAPPQMTDQTLRVQIRRDHRRPSFHAPPEGSACLPTRFTRRHGDPRASTRRDGLSKRRHSPAAPPKRSHALWNNLKRF
jgi:hypothetical protein